MADDKQQYKLATEEDFDKFVKECDSTDNKWVLCYEGDNVKVWDQKVENSPINIVKLHALFPALDADVLYDVLHDPEYRTVWDENMIEGFNIVQLDDHNDIGYYSAKVPTPITNRDFVNQRCWRIKDNKEYVIFNHSVVHPSVPEKKGFVRANSILTGYLVRKNDAGGSTLTYLTQTDPKGWIPTWLANKVTKTFAPTIVDKLTKAGAGYPDWKGKHNPDNKPWRK